MSEVVLIALQIVGGFGLILFLSLIAVSLWIGFIEEMGWSPGAAVFRFSDWVAEFGKWCARKLKGRGNRGEQ